MSQPPPGFLADVYRQLPFWVVHLTTDGTVLHCNPEVIRASGYGESELIGRNFWAILFPGKLFAQVPKFISLLKPSLMLTDVPMMIRTKQGRDRVIAFSRFTHHAEGRPGDMHHLDPTDSSSRTFICIGVDLTDRLLDADREKLPLAGNDASSADAQLGFGPHVGNAGAIDGEFVTPIAISPPAPKPIEGAPSSLEQVRDGMAKVEERMQSVRTALANAETLMIAALDSRRTSPTGAPAKALEILSRGDWIAREMNGKSIGAIRARVDELVKLHRPKITE